MTTAVDALRAACEKGTPYDALLPFTSLLSRRSGPSGIGAKYTSADVINLLQDAIQACIVGGGTKHADVVAPIVSELTGALIETVFWGKKLPYGEETTKVVTRMSKWIAECCNSVGCDESSYLKPRQELLEGFYRWGSARTTAQSEKPIDPLVTATYFLELTSVLHRGGSKAAAYRFGLLAIHSLAEGATVADDAVELLLLLTRGMDDPWVTARAALHVSVHYSCSNSDNPQSVRKRAASYGLQFLTLANSSSPISELVFAGLCCLESASTEVCDSFIDMVYAPLCAVDANIAALLVHCFQRHGCSSRHADKGSLPGKPGMDLLSMLSSVA